MTEKILIIDFGSQYTQLIARRIRELNIYSEIVPCDKIPDLTPEIKGIVLSGSPFSVESEQLPGFDYEKIKDQRPILGICYGAQFLAKYYGGEVKPSNKREYGRANLSRVINEDKLFRHVDEHSQVWMSHGDTITRVPDHFHITASTKSIPVAGFAADDSECVFPLYGIQFHPEVAHTFDGETILRNFTVDICGCSQDWTPDSFAEATVKELQDLLGNDHVVLGLSGGVDSTVAGLLLHRALGDRLHCIFVNNGLLRKNEFETVLDDYEHLGLNIRGIDAGSRFLGELAGVSDPETKRKIIGRIFIEVFQEAASSIKGVKWLGQGTIYPDIIESISVHGPSATIKSHHNVGGLPELLHLKVVEPLKSLFKDEVRRVGTVLGLRESLLNRHPFPGPGLSIRIIGDISEEKVHILQEADFIFINKLKEWNLYNDVWQAATILLPVQTVGVMGDERTYESVVALRAVGSSDGMTADWSHLPHDFLADVSSTIINEVKGINRVVYDISSKPPATIEWE